MQRCSTVPASFTARSTSVLSVLSYLRDAIKTSDATGLTSRSGISVSFQSLRVDKYWDPRDGFSDWPWRQRVCVSLYSHRVWSVGTTWVGGLADWYQLILVIVVASTDSPSDACCTASQQDRPFASQYHVIIKFYAVFRLTEDLVFAKSPTGTYFIVLSDKMAAFPVQWCD